MPVARERRDAAGDEVQRLKPSGGFIIPVESPGFADRAHPYPSGMVFIQLPGEAATGAAGHRVKAMAVPVEPEHSAAISGDPDFTIVVGGDTGNIIAGKAVTARTLGI